MLEEESTQETLKTCHHKRGQFQARITRVGSKLGKLVTLGPDKWPSYELDTHQAHIEQQVVSYRQLQEHIQRHYRLSPEEQDTEQIASDKFEDSASNLMGEIARMRKVA